MDTAELEKLEDLFYETDGTYDQISDQLDAYIREHREVTELRRDTYNHAISDYDDLTVYRDYVIYSAYDDTWTNNLNDVAVEGRVQFRTKHQDFFGGKAIEAREDYKSEIMENPTWMEVALCANDMINVTGDTHHVFLEGIHKTGQFTLDNKSFILIYDFSMGS